MTGAFSASAPHTLLLADVSNEQYEQYEQIGRKGEPWAPTCAGIAISLADRVTIKDREAHVNSERAVRDQRAASLYGDNYRQIHGMGKVFVT